MPRRFLPTIGLLLLAGPLIPPLLVEGSKPASLAVFTEWDRLASLLSNTVLLSLFAVAVALPLGSLLALVVARGPAIPSQLLRTSVLVGLAVPLPVTAIAWQAVLGGWLPSMTLQPGVVEWRAWNTGLLPAGWVHAMAAVPWVAWIVSGVLARTDAVLEDDALLNGGRGAVLRQVVLPRAGLASLVAAGWVGVQTATEIPVTDSMMVRTIAEEVYTQLVGDVSKVGAAVAVTLPVWAVGAVVGVIAVRRVRVSAEVQPARRLLGWGWTATGVVVAALAIGVPVVALLVKASAGGLVDNLTLALRANWQVLLTSLLWAAVAGMTTAWLAWRACWHASRTRWLGRLLAAVCVLLFLAPGPVVGFALKKNILQLVLFEDMALGGRSAGPVHPLAFALWEQPSPLPVLWAALVRLFPVGCAVLWPAVRAVPRELTDAAAVDGGYEWQWAVAPETWRTFAAAAVSVTALALGEVSAAKIVAPPGYDSFILRLFAQMHYGAEATVAALSVIQLGLSGGLMLAALAVMGNENRRGP